MVINQSDRFQLLLLYFEPIKTMNRTVCYSTSQFVSLFLLRIFIGWHFLYEGVVKIISPGWTAYPYLMDSTGFLSGIFRGIADSSSLLAISNYANMIGLTFVGLALILGIFNRCAGIVGIFFLLLFYLSHPPFIGSTSMFPTEGSYLWIDKNLIEVAGLLVLLFFPTAHILGLDRLTVKTNK